MLALSGGSVTLEHKKTQTLKYNFLRANRYFKRFENIYLISINDEAKEYV